MVCRKIFIAVMGLALEGMASATTSFYTSQSLFNAATSGMTFQTINDLTSATASGTGLLDPLTGVNFTDQNGGSSLLSVIDGLTLKLSSGFQLGIQVPSTFTAYWFDIVPVSFGAAINESSTNPASSNGLTTLSTPVFFGIVTDTPVIGLQLGAGTSGLIEIDNFNVAGSAGSASPETGTMTMIGGGLILLRAIRVRRMRNAT
jgi:hypothetical protein